MLNPDGRLWVDRLGEGISDTGETLSAADGERIVRLVAHHVGVEGHAAAPRVSAELPEGGERFEGLLPPVVAAPAFAIRKPAVAVFTLDDYARPGSCRRPRRCATASRSRQHPRRGRHRPARPRWSMRCWPKSPRPPIASS
jgi:Flp pilus assembly CpaF family ATPase